VAQTFATRAQNWQNVFNPGSGFLQPKESGPVPARVRPHLGQTGFVEADSYVYTAMVPFDLEGLIAAEGGNAPGSTTSTD
jgi:putative alpha-1,2-mannosidase